MKTNRHLKDLFELLSIPTVSAQSIHKKNMIRACNWLTKKFESLGFSSKIVPTKGHPVVFSQNLEAGNDGPTILVYGHYDVQSPDPLQEWKTPPFKPTIKNGNIYCRGVADDKGQLYTWVAAIEEILRLGKSLPVNIKFLIEGEEEVGSTNIDAFVKQQKKLLRADVCVISDSHALSEKQPLITYGVRGLTYVEIKVKTLAKDCHSGLYGGNVLNPINVLAGIIANLKDKNSKILIPGFYSKVRKLSKQELLLLKKFPFTSVDIKNETGAEIVTGEENFSIPARAGARPTLDVNGIWGGYQGEGPKTIIPAEANAKISMRLVPNQGPDEIFRLFCRYIRKITPKGAKVEIKQLSGGKPLVMNYQSSFFKTAEKAYEKVFGAKPLYELSGGSIPITATFKELMGIDCLLMGYGLPDDGLHSPNEKMSLTMFEKGIATNREFLLNI